MSVNLYKLVTGEEVIANAITRSSESIEIEDAVRIVYHPTQDGRMSAGFAPFAPYAEGRITLFNRSIVAESEVKSDMLSEYNRIFSNIVIAPASILQ